VTQPGGPAAGWYADPGGSGGLRWWDGSRWTDHVAPPPPPVAPMAARPSAADELEQERTLGRYLRIFFILGAIGQIISLLATVQSVPAFREWIDIITDGRPLGPGEELPALAISSPLMQLAWIVTLGLGVLEIAWLWRVTQLARAVGLITRRSPGLAAFSFLIPIVNLWWPYQSVMDVLPAGHAGRETVRWWWGFTVGAGFASYVPIGLAFVSTGWAWLAALAVAAAVVQAAVLGRQVVSTTLAAHETMVADVVGTAMR